MKFTKFSKCNSKNKINFNDFELNIMSYKDAIKYDKRTILSYYNSLIKTKHPIIFSFCPIKDYNSIIIKIDLFALYFSLHYFFNSLFFDEAVIHKIYEDEGIYNFIYLLPFISYSFIISHTLYILIKYFSLSERNLYDIKNEKKLKEASDKVYKLSKILPIKYILFFVLGILFQSFLWYFLSSFGAVYQNSQVYLFENTLISLAFSLIYPFIINLIHGIIRIYSLKESKRECLFKISKFIQLI